LVEQAPGTRSLTAKRATPRLESKVRYQRLARQLQR
jgi:hypothetical protein